MEAKALIETLDRVAPGFAAYYAAPSNLFDNETLCSVFASCSHFVREHPVSIASWSAIATLLNDLVAGSDEAASTAACTCFLENLADPLHPLKPFLDGKALRFWMKWEAVTK